MTQLEGEGGRRVGSSGAQGTDVLMAGCAAHTQDGSGTALGRTGWGAPGPELQGWCGSVPSSLAVIWHQAPTI